MGIFIRFGGIFVIMLLASGCAHQVAFQDIDYQVDEQVRSEPVIAVISEAERARVVPVRSVMTGVAHSWDAEPGEMLVQVSEVELPQMFERFKLVSAHNSEGDSYLLHLAVPSYTFTDFRAILTVHAKLVDLDGQELFDRLYEAEGPSRGGRMFWGGAFGMKSAMRSSSIEAFQEIFRKLREDLNHTLDELSTALAGSTAKASTD